MADQPKEVRGRIRSVTSTRKITKTMELVATSKMKRAQDRVNAALPYTAKLRELLTEIVAGASSLNEPLLNERDNPKKVAVLLVTANRGLCGGYNSNVIRAAKRLIAELKEKGREVQIDVVGKKGVGTLRFQGYTLNRTYTDLSDKPSYDDAMRFIGPLRDEFLAGKIDEAHIIWTHWKSAASQTPQSMRLLPLERPKASAKAGETSAKSGQLDFLFDPSPAALLGKLLPMYLSQTMYTCLVEATAGEQVARRTAMKSATDNASELITDLTRRLNRARQAQITQEIAEVCGGAAALQK